MGHAPPSPRRSDGGPAPTLGLFPETSWTLIQRAGGGGAPARAALGELLERYQSAIRFLVQRRGPVLGMTADDLLQEFMLHLATPTPSGESRLTGLDPIQGRFRNWLSRSLQNKISNVRRATLTHKSGLGRICSFDEECPDDRTTLEPLFDLDQGFEDDLALAEAYSHCHLALERVKAKEPEARFAELRRYLPGSELHEDRLESGARLGLRPNSLTKTITRIRARFVLELTKVVSERVGSRLADPGLDPAIRKERDRIVRMLLSHEWAPPAHDESAL